MNHRAPTAAPAASDSTASDSAPRNVTYSRAGHAAWRRIGDETVLLDQRGHRLLGLNQAAGNVWHRLTEPRTAGELAAELAAQSVDELVDVLADERDVFSFLEELRKLGLVEGSSEVPIAANDADENDDERRSAAAPSILWQEPIEQAAQTAACAFLPAQNPLCNSAPFS